MYLCGPPLPNLAGPLPLTCGPARDSDDRSGLRGAKPPCRASAAYIPIGLDNMSASVRANAHGRRKATADAKADGLQSHALVAAEVRIWGWAAVFGGGRNTQSDLTQLGNAVANYGNSPPTQQFDERFA